VGTAELFIASSLPHEEFQGTASKRRPIKRFFRVLLFVVLAVLLAATGLATGIGVYAVRRAFPQASGRIALDGLRGTVEVMRDQWGIPHIYAQNDLDLFFAQGFVHAQDRLWQMEFNRRAASGRLSEIFGPVTLDTDRFLRTVGLRRAAEVEAAQLDDETKRVLQAYVDGVNAYIASRRGRLPLEFALLRYVPEPWSPVDAVAFGKLMAWTLSGNWDSEILRAHLLSRFGEAGVARLMPAYPDEMPVIVPAGADYRPFRSAAALRLAAHAPARNGTGSNNWVIAGSRTTTGAPILANDPHLEAAMPSIWYEMDLSSERFHVAGATFAGAPGVIIGHNERIAWGVTNAGPDVQDLYLERFDPDDPARYEFQGQWERATVVEESIIVKGRRDPVILPVRITRHGPILNGVVDGLDAFVALRWTALMPGTILGSVLRLDQARNWEEFREALRLWTVPAQNFVYADTDGNIGYQLPGRIPVRAKGNGLLPVPGWTGEYEWVGEIPFDELPSSFNPERGYIITANNRIIPDDYTHFIAAEWDPGFRAQRIETMLTAQPKVSPEVVADMQLDTSSLPAQAILRALRGVQIGRARSIIARRASRLGRRPRPGEPGGSHLRGVPRRAAASALRGCARPGDVQAVSRPLGCLDARDPPAARRAVLPVVGTGRPRRARGKSARRGRRDPHAAPGVESIELDLGTAARHALRASDRARTGPRPDLQCDRPPDRRRCVHRQQRRVQREDLPSGDRAIIPPDPRRRELGPVDGDPHYRAERPALPSPLQRLRDRVGDGPISSALLQFRQSPRDRRGLAHVVSAVGSLSVHCRRITLPPQPGPTRTRPRRP